MRLRDIFATNLRRARNSAGLTQEDLAQSAEMDRSYVSELEGAKYSATIDMIESLARALNVSPASLLSANTQAGRQSEQG
jgi:transcriptional regulator with XRE-family HTH domain